MSYFTFAAELAKKDEGTTYADKAIPKLTYPLSREIILKAVEKMLQQGGSFVVSLANCWLHADAFNKKTLEVSFSHYFEQYAQLAEAECTEILLTNGGKPHGTNMDQK